ncbi:MAG: biotin-dependent carboxyltransferase family protein [bacterium]|nr:biotin-dependent carboxyltransferase family protein [bacterium]
MNMLRVQEPGMLSSVQDLGRMDYRHLGVPRSGAFDTYAFRVGNLLLGNNPSDAAIEMTMVGGRFSAQSDMLVALTGARAHDATMRRNSTSCGMRMDSVHLVEAGTEISIGRLTDGVRTYMCIGGGVQIEALLGSRSSLVSYPQLGLGRALLPGDLLPIEAATAMPASLAFVKPIDYRCETIRITPGAHWDAFTANQREHLTDSTFVVSDHSNRVGIRLGGSSIPGTIPQGMRSSGTIPGDMQIPPSGEPIILGVDGPTSGGYPVMGCVIEADLPLVAQLPPRSRVRFDWVAKEAAWEENAARACLLEGSQHEK